MKTWDDVKNVYYRIACGLHKKFRRFEVDELVDEAYVWTYPYWEWDLSELAMRVYQRMMDYIRKDSRRYVIGQGHSLKNKRQISECSLESFNTDVPFDMKDSVEVWDYIETKSKILTLEEKILLVLKYDYDLPLFRIGELFNYYHSEAGRRLKKALAKMRLSTKETEQLLCEQIMEGSL